MDGSGKFLHTVSGYVPMCLDGVPVLFQKWRVDADSPQSRKAYPGVRFRKQPMNGAAKGEMVLWDTVVYGNPVDDTWVKFADNNYLPQRFQDGRQVLWPEMGFATQPRASLESFDNVRLCLLAPATDKEWKYGITGTFTKWQNVYELKPSGLHLPANLANRGMALFSIEISIQDLKDAEFKFVRLEKTTFLDKVASLSLAAEKTVWEYDRDVRCNNRVIIAGTDLVPGSRLFTSWGKPDVAASRTDIQDFFRIALSGDTLSSLDTAVSSVDEVERSVCQVSCQNASFDAPDGIVASSLRIVLSDMLSGYYASSRPPPGQALYAWMAVLELKGCGNLHALNHLIREGFLSVVATWPINIVSHSTIACGIHAAAKAAVLEESCTGGRLSQQWLPAAIQTILHGGVSPDECEQMAVTAQRVVDAQGFSQWDAMCLKDARPHEVQSALKVALRPFGTAQEVWSAATRFLRQSPDAQVCAPLCAKLALQEALARWERLMNWDSIVSGLQALLDLVGEDAFNEEWQRDLTTIIRNCWETSQNRRNRIPELGRRSKSMVMLAKAITAEPDRAPFVEFDDKSDLAWLRLAAAIGFEEHVPAPEPMC